MAETFTPLPINAVAFARYILGNTINDALGIEADGSDFDLRYLREEAKNVLRSAVESARKDGRDYVEYKDYPTMASGERPEQFWRANRKARDLFGLYLESSTDPVIEMFTSVGGFKFKNRDDGGFEIPNDPYDFDESKSRKDRPVKDVFSTMTYMAQDVSGTYGFSLKGVIDPVDEAMISFDDLRRLGENVGISGAYFNNAISGAFNTLRDQLFGQGDIDPDKVPVEFTQFMRRGIQEHIAKNPTTSAFPLADVALPDASANADFLEGSVVVPTEEGHVIANEELEFQIPVASRERPVGRIPDVSFTVDADDPRVPAVIKSDEAVALSQRVVDSYYEETPNSYIGRDLSFDQAFARNRSAGKEEFTWRGNKYTTELAKEVG